MDGNVSVWDGAGWQDHCEQLLLVRYPNSYAVVPDTDRGDLGIEGYSTDGSGCAYQCYVPQAEQTGERVRAQKRKVTRDLAKLRDNAASMARLLGDVKIRRWVLLTPIHDSKELTAHCRAKEQDILGLELPFIDAGFRIDVQTVDRHFRRETQVLDRGGAGLVRLPPIEVDDKHMAALARQAPELLRNLEEKTSRLLRSPAAEGQRTRFRGSMQRYAVDMANLEAHLRVSHPVIYEQWLAQRQAEEQSVQLESDLGSSSESPTYVSKARERFETRLREEVPALRSGDSASRLSWGAVADWLRRCPMDFVTED